MWQSGWVDLFLSFDDEAALRRVIAQNETFVGSLGTEKTMSGFYPHGIDYEWFAADTKGRIARFTTGSLGPIPSAVLEADDVCEIASEQFAKLPHRGPARVLVKYPKLDDFIGVAESGIYTYDCDDLSSGSQTRRYHLVSAPTSPLTVADLPAGASDAVSLARLDDVVFGEALEIGPDQLGEIVSAD